MRVMDEVAEAAQRRTPSFQHAGAQSPRVGGSCAGAVYHLIQDWSLSKRFTSTKFIIADRPNNGGFYARRDGSFTDPSSTAAMTTPLKAEPVSNSKITSSAFQSPASVKSDATSKRSPGVVARLMGLESLPERTITSSSKSSSHSETPAVLGPPPSLLPELLRLELQHSKKSFKEKLPSFTKKSQDPKTPVAQKKKPGVRPREQERPYVNSRAPKPSSRQEDFKGPVKRPFLARLQQTGVTPSVPSSELQNSHSTNLSSMPQNSRSPLLSPSMLGARNTVRLLEAAVKVLEPPAAPRRKYSLTIGDSRRTESGRPEKRALGASSFSRGGSPANSATKPGRSQLVSGKDDRTESNSSGSRSNCRASSRPVSRTRQDTTLIPASAPLESSRPRIANPKRVKDSPRALLRTEEASIRDFKTELGDSPSGKKLKMNDSLPQAVELLEPVVTPPPITKTDSSEPCTPCRNIEADTSQSTPASAPEKPRGFRSMRFRSIGGKQEKSALPSSPKEAGEVNCEDQGKQEFPSELKPSALTSSKEAKVAGFSYNVLFRKQGTKKEGHESGETPVPKRTDSTWMRHLMRKPSTIPGTSKLSEKVHAEVTESVERRESSAQEPALSTTHHQDGANVLQTRSRSIDDVFPELPMEVKDARCHSPGLAKTSHGGEELQSLRHSDANYLSIERMFGKDFSRSRMTAELASPELSPAPGTSPECGVPGTFPNSPKFETKVVFSSSSQLNLHDMFEVVSGNRSHDSASRRRSFCLSEPRERILNDEDAEEAESDTYSHSIGGASEHLENHKISVPAGWMTPPALREFEEKLAHESIMSTPQTLKEFEENLAIEEKLAQECIMSTPQTLKEFEENLANEGSLSTPPALKKFEEELAQEDLAMSTPPALKKFEEELEQECAMSTPPALKKFEEILALEGVMTPPALKTSEEKLAHGVVTISPPGLKNFEKDPPQGFPDVDDGHVLCLDEFGQPSPVSVLQSPFLDEVPTTPDASIAEAERVGETEPSAVKDDEDESQEANENTATSKLSEAAMPEVIQTDMIEKAILDISRIRSIDVTKLGLEPQRIAPVEPYKEKNYIREVLDLVREEGDFPWHSGLNQSLFKILEFGSRKHCPSVRSERKLLFDSVHEVVALKPWLKTSSFYVELPMFPDLHANSKFRSPIAGEELVHEVHRMFSHWKDIAGNCLDDLVDYDMNVPEGRWVNFGQEVADIGFDIERTLLHVLIAEVVDDLTSLVPTRG